MQQRGYSLVEMVVIIGIISIVLAIATPNFNDYLKRFRTEAQARMLYSELLTARANALYQRRETRVKLYANKFEIYSSACDSGSGVAPISTQILRYPIVWNQSGNSIDFDERGMGLNTGCICIDAGEGTGGVDSVVISDLRVRIGKKDKGDDCKATNITVR
jgi:prepilin-type N-terminal cleavage/methylation domain-containing protein